MATLEVSQSEGNDHCHSISLARFHTNPSNLRIEFVQVEKRELPKDFRGPPIGSRVQVRNFIEEDWSRVCCGLLGANLLFKVVRSMVRYVYAVT